MKYLTNLYDPRKQDAPMTVHHGPYETPDEAWKHQQEWLKGKHIGRPQATTAYTVEELEAMGYVGIYSMTDEEGK